MYNDKKKSPRNTTTKHFWILSNKLDIVGSCYHIKFTLLGNQITVFVFLLGAYYIIKNNLGALQTYLEIYQCDIRSGNV